MPTRHVTRVTRGHQITIPRAVREQTGLHIGELLEVAAGDDGTVVLRRVPVGEPSVLRWGREFGKRHRIRQEDIVEGVRSVRRELFATEYG